MELHNLDIPLPAPIGKTKRPGKKSGPGKQMQLLAAKRNPNDAKVPDTVNNE
jgi:hypothetical protein